MNLSLPVFIKVIFYLGNLELISVGHILVMQYVKV